MFETKTIKNPWSMDHSSTWHHCRKICHQTSHPTNQNDQSYTFIVLERLAWTIQQVVEVVVVNLHQFASNKVPPVSTKMTRSTVFVFCRCLKETQFHRGRRRPIGLGLALKSWINSKSLFFPLFMSIGSLFMTYIPSGCHFGSLIDRPHHFVGPRNWSNPNMSNTHHTHTRADTLQYFHLSPLALSCSISANLLIARKATPCRTFNVHNQHCTKKQEQS